ncbi:hypothetical protein ADL27_26430, partial [Streptomyces sp. NRRL F-6602]
ATLAAHQGHRRDRDAALLRFRRAGGEDSLLVPLQRGLCLAVGALLEEDRRGAREHLEAAVAWERERPSLYFLGGRWGLLPLVRALDGTGDIAGHRAALASHASSRLAVLARDDGAGPLDEVEALFQEAYELVEEGSDDRLLSADVDSGLLLIRSNAPGQDRLGW